MPLGRKNWIFLGYHVFHTTKELLLAKKQMYVNSSFLPLLPFEQDKLTCETYILVVVAKVGLAQLQVFIMHAAVSSSGMLRAIVWKF